MFLFLYNKKIYNDSELMSTLKKEEYKFKCVISPWYKYIFKNMKMKYATLKHISNNELTIGYNEYI